MSHVIDGLELSARATAALKRHYPDIGVEEFLALTEDDLSAMKNVGVRTVWEIQSAQGPLRRVANGQADWGDALRLLEEINDILSRRPAFRVVVDPDARLSLAKTNESAARRLDALRGVYRRQSPTIR